MAEGTDTSDSFSTPDPRGAATRAELVAAGLELFGRRGYHATSNRALADAAGANQALIGYHFGGKKGLYLAVFEHIADGFEARLGPTAAELLTRLEDPATAGNPEALLELVQTLIERAAGLFASPETARWAMLIVREQQNPSEAFDVVWERIMSRMSGLLCRILGALGRTSPQDQDVKLLALTLISQPLVFRVARETALRLLGWEAIGEAELDAVHRRLRRNVRSLLLDFVANGPAAPDRVGPDLAEPDVARPDFANPETPT